MTPEIYTDDPRFQFTPFSEQDTYETFEEQKLHPKMHNILLLADFSDLPESEYAGACCPTCEQEYTHVVKEIKRGWGDIEQLNYIIPDVPTLECDCKLFIQFETSVRERLLPVSDTVALIYDTIGEILAIGPSAADVLADELPEDDIKKVVDFAENHWAPEGSVTAILRERRGKH